MTEPNIIPRVGNDISSQRQPTRTNNSSEGQLNDDVNMMDKYDLIYGKYLQVLGNSVGSDPGGTVAPDYTAERRRASGTSRAASPASESPAFNGGGPPRAYVSPDLEERDGGASGRLPRNEGPNRNSHRGVNTGLTKNGDQTTFTEQERDRRARSIAFRGGKTTAREAARNDDRPDVAAPVESPRADPPEQQYRPTLPGTRHRDRSPYLSPYSDGHRTNGVFSPTEYRHVAERTIAPRYSYVSNDRHYDPNSRYDQEEDLSSSRCKFSANHYSSSRPVYYASGDAPLVVASRDDGASVGSYGSHGNHRNTREDIFSRLDVLNAKSRALRGISHGGSSTHSSSYSAPRSIPPPSRSDTYSSSSSPRSLPIAPSPLSSLLSRKFPTTVDEESNDSRLEYLTRQSMELRNRVARTMIALPPANDNDNRKVKFEADYIDGSNIEPYPRHVPLASPAASDGVASVDGANANVVAAKSPSSLAMKVLSQKILDGHVMTRDQCSKCDEVLEASLRGEEEEHRLLGTVRAYAPECATRPPLGVAAAAAPSANAGLMRSSSPRRTSLVAGTTEASVVLDASPMPRASAVASDSRSRAETPHRSASSEAFPIVSRSSGGSVSTMVARPSSILRSASTPSLTSRSVAEATVEVSALQSGANPVSRVAATSTEPRDRVASPPPLPTLTKSPSQQTVKATNIPAKIDYVKLLEQIQAELARVKSREEPKMSLEFPNLLMSCQPTIGRVNGGACNPILEREIIESPSIASGGNIPATEEGLTKLREQLKGVKSASDNGDGPASSPVDLGTLQDQLRAELLRAKESQTTLELAIQRRVSSNAAVDAAGSGAESLEELEAELEKTKLAQFALEMIIERNDDPAASNAAKEEKTSSKNRAAEPPAAVLPSTEEIVAASPSSVVDENVDDKNVDDKNVDDKNVDDKNVDLLVPSSRANLSYSISQQEVDATGHPKEFIPPPSYFSPYSAIPSEVVVHYHVVPEVEGGDASIAAQSHHLVNLKRTDRDNLQTTSGCCGGCPADNDPPVNHSQNDEGYDFDTIETDDDYTADYTLNTLDDARLNYLHTTQECDDHSQASDKSAKAKEITSVHVQGVAEQRPKTRGCVFLACLGLGCAGEGTGDDANSLAGPGEEGIVVMKQDQEQQGRHHLVATSSDERSLANLSGGEDSGFGSMVRVGEGVSRPSLYRGKYSADESERDLDRSGHGGRTGGRLIALTPPRSGCAGADGSPDSGSDFGITSRPAERPKILPRLSSANPRIATPTLPPLRFAADHNSVQSELTDYSSGVSHRRVTFDPTPRAMTNKAVEHKTAHSTIYEGTEERESLV